MATETDKGRSKTPPKVKNMRFRDGGYYFRAMVNGQEVARATGTADPKEAARLGAIWIAEFRDEVLSGTAKPKLHTLIDDYLATKKSKETMLCHFTPIKNNIADKDLKDISEAEVINAMDTRKCSPNTRAVMVNYWLAFANWCQKKDYGIAPTIQRLKKVKTREYYLTIDEVKALFRAVDPDADYPGKTDRSDRARQDRLDLMVLLFSTGARFSEISHATFSQWDQRNAKFYLVRKKGGTNLDYPCSPLMTSIFIRRFNDSHRNKSEDWIFPSGKHNSSHRWIHEACDRAGIKKPGPVTLHTLRHSFAKLMLDLVDIASTQQLLGHRHISTTMEYIHLRESEVNKKASDYMAGLNLLK